MSGSGRGRGGGYRPGDGGGGRSTGGQSSGGQEAGNGSGQKRSRKNRKGGQGGGGGGGGRGGRSGGAHAEDSYVPGSATVPGGGRGRGRGGRGRGSAGRPSGTGPSGGPRGTSSGSDASRGRPAKHARTDAEDTAPALVPFGVTSASAGAGGPSHAAAGGGSSAGVRKPAGPPSASASASASASHALSDTPFRSLGLSAPTQRALDDIFGYPNCTPVQAKAIPPAARGTDVMARARTGTGKTLGFLIPALERLAGPARAPGGGVRGVSVLVVSPARELALQTHKDAVKLLQYRHGMRAECVIGGTNMKSEARRMRDQGVDVLVATPGRLLDHAENTPGMRAALGRVQVLVLDECDQLLDRGFLIEVRKILALLPRTADRQTLLFSATISSTIQEVAKVALKPDHVFVNTVKETGAPTHEAVSQEAIAAEPHALMHTLWRVLAHHAAKEDKFKVILFTPTGEFDMTCP